MLEALFSPTSVRSQIPPGEIDSLTVFLPVRRSEVPTADRAQARGSPGRWLVGTARGADVENKMLDRTLVFSAYLTCDAVAKELELDPFSLEHRHIEQSTSYVWVLI